MALQTLSRVGIQRALTDVVDLCPHVRAGKHGNGRGIAVAMVGPALTAGFPPALLQRHATPRCLDSALNRAPLSVRAQLCSPRWLCRLVHYRVLRTIELTPRPLA